jgi:transcriptional regulator with XRE-family HTH domain
VWEIGAVDREPPEEIRSEVLGGFSARLVAARQAAGLSRAQLAERCGLHPSEISLFERGGREPRLGTLVKLAVALDVPPADLCAGIAWDPERRRFE